LQEGDLVRAHADDPDALDVRQLVIAPHRDHARDTIGRPLQMPDHGFFRDQEQVERLFPGLDLDQGEACGDVLAGNRHVRLQLRVLGPQHGEELVGEWLGQIA
jgi:hypothetical protein